jgi:pimeloyl-ACP methyl ester carboxylesterase
MLPHLRAASRRVLIVESAGHGLSGFARGTYTTTRHLESTTAVLDQLLEEPALIVGNSLGGATALHYASVRPERVRALFLTSPGGAPLDAATIESLRRVFAMRTVRDARAFIELVFARPTPLAPVLAWIMRSKAASPAVADLLHSVDQEHLSVDALAGLTMPVMLVWGRSERILPPSALAYFRAHLPAHVEILEPEGFGHCPHLDNPKRLARAITEFASERSSNVRSIPSSPRRQRLHEH